MNEQLLKTDLKPVGISECWKVGKKTKQKYQKIKVWVSA
jgi:hypothetical protein